MPYQSFENLDVWKRACRLSVQVYESLRECRDYGLKDQMTKAAVSIASNIAEGYERDTTRDFIRFLRIAKGSAAELRTQLYIAASAGLLTRDQINPLLSEAKQISAMLHSLAKSRSPQNPETRNLKPEP